MRDMHDEKVRRLQQIALATQRAQLHTDDLQKMLNRNNTGRMQITITEQEDGEITFTGTGSTKTTICGLIATIFEIEQRAYQTGSYQAETITRIIDAGLEALDEKRQEGLA